MANMNVLNDRKETSKVGLDVRTLANILMRRLPLFMAVAVAVILIALTASLIIRPVYQATANVRIDPNQKSALDLASIAQGAPPTRRWWTARFRLIRSSDVARGAIATLGLLADPEFNPKLHGRTPLTLPALSDRDKEAAVQRVLGRLEAAREGSTYIVDLKFKSGIPQGRHHRQRHRRIIFAGGHPGADRHGDPSTGLNCTLDRPRWTMRSNRPTPRWPPIRRPTALSPPDRRHDHRAADQYGHRGMATAESAAAAAQLQL